MIKFKKRKKIVWHFHLKYHFIGLDEQEMISFHIKMQIGCRQFSRIS